MKNLIALLMICAASVAYSQPFTTQATVSPSGTFTSGDLICGGPGSTQINDCGLAPIKTYSSSSDPGASNDNTQGYSIGSWGINTSTGRTFIAFSVATSAAVWLPRNSDPYQANYVANNWYIARGHETSAIGVAIASATTMALAPFWVHETFTVNTLGSKIQTVGTSNYQIGIYAVDANFKPTGVPIAHTGDIVDTATGTSSGAITTVNGGAGSSVQLQPGMYFAAVAANDTTVIFDGPASSIGWLAAVGGNATLANLSGGIGANMFNGYTTTVASYSTWPDLTSCTCTVVNNGQKAGLLFLKVASVP